MLEVGLSANKLFTDDLATAVCVRREIVVVIMRHIADLTNHATGGKYRAPDCTGGGKRTEHVGHPVDIRIVLWHLLSVQISACREMNDVSRAKVAGSMLQAACIENVALPPELFVTRRARLCNINIHDGRVLGH